MNIEYEIYTLENASGTGRERQFVRLKTGQPLSPERAALHIQEGASATVGDVKAVMSAMHDFVRSELLQGRRVYLPEIGYLSLSVGITPPEQKASGRITGRDIHVRGVNFKPDAHLLSELKHRIHFFKSEHPTRSTTLPDDELWTRALSRIEQECHLTLRSLRAATGLSAYKARRCLKQWLAQGRLTQEGTPRHRFYMLPEQQEAQE